MTKNSATKLALVLVGFAIGAVGGAVGVQAAPAQRDTPEVLVSHAAPRPAASVAQIHEVALQCGVYGLPGSPAIVALTAGADGRPVRAAIESDIFGGDDAEACIRDGLAGLPMASDTVRVVLPNHLPEELALR